MSLSQSRVKLPSYRHHRASGQAFVVLSGRHVYLGPHGTKLSRDNFDRVVAEWLERGRTIATAEATTSIAVLLNAFRKADVIPASHADAYKAVIKIMVRLYALTPADEFGAVALKVVRSEMVAAGWKRRTVNHRIHNLRRIFKWGVENQIVAPAGLLAMREVEPLRAGRTTAAESKAVKPVSADHVEACIAKMTPTVAAMVRLQMLTGMRAGELCIMRTTDIDASSDVWVYVPTSHKTQNAGKVREIPLGPKAIEILRPLLKSVLTDFVFSPAQADAERRAALTLKRQTPAGRGNAVGTNRARVRRRSPGDRYTTPSYRRAIEYATNAAFPPPPALARHRGETRAEWKARLGTLWPDVIAFEKAHHWHPHQLRHAFGTAVINAFSAEHAQRSLGHSNLKATQIYAKLSLDKAKEVAKAIG